MSIAGVLGLGVGLRLYHYLAQRSLWIDVARLPLNIGARSYAGLLRPLDYDQAAPPLFLFAEKFATRIWGMDELSLRLFPLVGGLALLFLIRLLMRRLLAPVESLIVVTIVSVSPVLIYYSNELKPYGIDAAVTSILVILARKAADAPSWRRAGTLGLAGAVAVWLSTPSIFVLSGIGLSWLVFRPRGLRYPAHAAAVGTCWLVSFVIAYESVYRPTSTSAYLRQFWQYRLLDPGHPDLARRIWYALREAVLGLLAGTASGRELTAFWSTSSHVLTALAILLVITGASCIRRRAGTFEAALIVMPLFAVLAASAVGYYPIALRVTLFASPLVLILVVSGGGKLVESAAKRMRPFVAGALISCLGFSPYFTALGLIDPHGWEHARPTIRDLERRIHIGEAIFIDAGALPAWIFYTTNWEAPDTTRLAFAASIGSSGGPAFENSAPRGHPVGAEGDTIAYDGPLGPEIFGLFTGMQWRWGVGLAEPLPDSGWATNETRRMTQRPEQSWWALFTHDFGSSGVLRRAFEAAGAKEVFSEERGHVQLIRYTRN